MSEEAEAIKRALTGARRIEPIGPADLLSTGSTLLNLACSGCAEGGFVKGRYFFLVGDSASGKTFLSLTCLAEAARNPHFGDYRFIYDGPEGGALMDLERYFGRRAAERIEPPATDESGVPVYSSTVEEFYFHLDDALRAGRPFIYILDSMDSLSSEAEADKFDQVKRAYRLGRAAAGSYGDNKAKVNSANLRRILGPLRETGSILLILNQTRDSFDPFVSRTRSGGHALRFYATVELWSSVKKRLTRTVKGKERLVGVSCKVEVRKNRLTGREISVLLPIYYSTGIDDVGSCVDYLVDEGRWKTDGSGRILVTGLGPESKGHREAVIRRIEERGLEEDLRLLVADTWKQIEEASAVQRKRRYE